MSELGQKASIIYSIGKVAKIIRSKENLQTPDRELKRNHSIERFCMELPNANEMMTALVLGFLSPLPLWVIVRAYKWAMQTLQPEPSPLDRD